MQYALPIDGYASEYNDDIEFFVACYQHTDDPLQSFIITELESDFAYHESHGATFTPDWGI